ncbi:MAG: hypothetical protein ACREM8_13795, partial [Vulcanimicrobiaceae bacterium]
MQGQIAAQAFPQVIDQIKTNGGIDVKGQGQAIINGYQGETPRETALKRAEMQRDLDAATTVGTSIKGVKEMPDADAQQFVRDVQARINVETDPDKLKGLEETLKGAQETITKRDEQFKKDPAGYVLNNSAPTSNAYATFTKNPSPASFSAYAQASSAEQRRMYPDHVPSLVTADMAAQASAVVRSITQGPEGSAGAAKQLQDMSKMYGQYWPTIAQDLMHRKVFDGDQYVAAALYSKPEAQGISEQILAASAMKNGELFNQHGVTDGAARHSAIEALQPLQASLGNANNGGELMSSYVNALTHVIQYTSTDKNNLVDAGVIANKMILDEFKFVGPGGTLRVPTSQNADAISSGAESVLDAIDKHDLVVPPSAGALGPTAQKANWIHQLQMTGRWF